MLFNMLVRLLGRFLLASVFFILYVFFALSACASMRARARARACSTPCRASPAADQVLEILPTVGGISRTLLPAKASYDRWGS